jgi:hypothetical protein
MKLSLSPMLFKSNSKALSATLSVAIKRFALILTTTTDSREVTTIKNHQKAKKCFLKFPKWSLLWLPWPAALFTLLTVSVVHKPQAVVLFLQASHP